MKILIIMLLLAATAAAQSDSKLAYTVSSTNLNSMACPSGAQVTDVFISERAQLKAETRGDRLFFEFTATKYETPEGYSNTVYATEATTIVLFCGETEYTIKLSPRRMDGVSIGLPIREEQLRKSELDGLRREEQIAKIIELALLDKLSSSKVENGDKATKIGDKEFYLRRVHSIAGYNVKEVYVYSAAEATVTEDELLSLDFIAYPVAATLSEQAFSGWLRLVVIEDAYAARK